MASIDTYLGFQWGVDKLVLTEDDGAAQPQLLSAVAQDPNTVRMTFDIDMMFLEDLGSVLKPGNWEIAEQVSGDPLPIYWISKVSDKIVDVHVSNMKTVNYEAVTTAKSAWDQSIDPANDTVSFAGVAKSYPSFASVYALFGLESGAQDEQIDVSAPYIENQDPAPLTTGVAQTKSIEFDLLDAEGNLDLTTVEIWVEGDKIYDGATDTFLSGVGFDFTGSTRTPIVNGHHFTLDPASDWPPYEVVTTRVYAEDTASFSLDTTWIFTTEDKTDPYIDTNFPTGVGASKSTAVTFSAHDDESGVDSTTLNVTIGGTAAITGGVFQAGFSGTVTPDGSGGVDVVINKDTDYDSFVNVLVSVSIDDLEGNSGVLNWSFSVEDYYGCLVTPINPTNGQTDFPTTGSLVLQVEDEDEVVVSSVKVEIDYGMGYEVALEYVGGSFQFNSGWDGPGSEVVEVGGVYTITIDPTSDFAVGSTILVRVTAADPTGNPERLS